MHWESGPKRRIRMLSGKIEKKKLRKKVSSRKKRSFGREKRGKTQRRRW